MSLLYPLILLVANLGSLPGIWPTKLLLLSFVGSLFPTFRRDLEALNRKHFHESLAVGGQVLRLHAPRPPPVVYGLHKKRHDATGRARRGSERCWPVQGRVALRPSCKYFN